MFNTNNNNRGVLGKMIKKKIEKIKLFVYNVLNHNKIVNDLQSKINDLQSKIKELNNEIIRLEDEYSESAEYWEEMLADYEKKLNDVEAEKEVLQKKLGDLVKTKKVDLDEVKEWYETILGYGTWRYNFDSEGTKNVVYAFRYKNPKNGHQKIRNVSKDIIEGYNINKKFKPEEIVECVMKYFGISGNWHYRTDDDLYGVREYWAEPDLSAEKRQGDCDSLAILMHYVIKDLFKYFGKTKNNWRLKFAVSRMLGGGAHAYNIWLHDDGEWYVVESTYDLQGSYKRTWLKTPLRHNNMYFGFWGFADENRAVLTSGVSNLRNIRDNK